MLLGFTFFLSVQWKKQTNTLSICFFRCQNKTKDRENWGKATQKQTWASDQTFSEKKCVCLVSRGFGCNAYPHPLRIAAVGSARYCIITNWLSKQSTHLQVWLAGGFNPSEKYESQLGWYSHILWKNNPHVPNHQPGEDWIQVSWTKNRKKQGTK